MFSLRLAYLTERWGSGKREGKTKTRGEKIFRSCSGYNDSFSATGRQEFLCGYKGQLK